MHLPVNDTATIPYKRPECQFQQALPKEIRLALCAMMEALTGDVRFTEQVEELLEKQRKGEEIIMCEYIDMLEARGEARGI